MYMYMYMYMRIMLYSREMVKAMQDPEAGVKLTEFRGKGATKYFTGVYNVILYVIHIPSLYASTVSPLVYHVMRTFQ